MVTITLYVSQQKRHSCLEQSFRLCGRGQGQDDMREWHWNMYIIISETDWQSRFDAWYRVLGAGALGWPRMMRWGGRWEGGSGWGTHVHPWWIHVNVWQNQYNIVKLKKKEIIFLKKKKKIVLAGEQDGGGVGGRGVHLSLRIHQKYSFRHRNACRTPAESWQEYLTGGKE